MFKKYIEFNLEQEHLCNLRLSATILLLKNNHKTSKRLLINAFGISYFVYLNY